jgi:hypothetical protein
VYLQGSGLDLFEGCTPEVISNNIGYLSAMAKTTIKNKATLCKIHAAQEAKVHTQAQALADVQNADVLARLASAELTIQAFNLKPVASKRH